MARINTGDAREGGPPPEYVNSPQSTDEATRHAPQEQHDEASQRLRSAFGLLLYCTRARRTNMAGGPSGWRDGGAPANVPDMP
jgi:hypothetical protein